MSTESPAHVISDEIWLLREEMDKQFSSARRIALTGCIAAFSSCLLLILGLVFGVAWLVSLYEIALLCSLAVVLAGTSILAHITSAYSTAVRGKIIAHKLRFTPFGYRYYITVNGHSVLGYACESTIKVDQEIYVATLDDTTYPPESPSQNT